MFQDNKQKWSIMLLKSKPFQEVMGEYTTKISSLVEKEVAKNRQQLSMYLTHPRIFKEKVPSGVKLPKDVKVHEMGSLTRNNTESKSNTAGTPKSNMTKYP